MGMIFFINYRSIKKTGGGGFGGERGWEEQVLSSESAAWWPPMWPQRVPVLLEVAMCTVDVLAALPGRSLQCMRWK